MIIFVVTNMTDWLVVIPVPSDNPQPASQRYYMIIERIGPIAKS